MWQAKAETEATLERACQDRMKLSGRALKFAEEERKPYVRRYKKQPPKGC
jgi:hypothetical protein